MEAHRQYRSLSEELAADLPQGLQPSVAEWVEHVQHRQQKASEELADHRVADHRQLPSAGLAPLAGQVAPGIPKRLVVTVAEPPSSPDPCETSAVAEVQQAAPETAELPTCSTASAMAELSAELATAERK